MSDSESLCNLKSADILVVVLRVVASALVVVADLLGCVGHI